MTNQRKPLRVSDLTIEYLYIYIFNTQVTLALTVVCSVVEALRCCTVLVLADLPLCGLVTQHMRMVREFTRTSTTNGCM